VSSPVYIDVYHGAELLNPSSDVGDDVEMVIQRLVSRHDTMWIDSFARLMRATVQYTASGQDAEATGYGIVVIDEIDKLARREPSATKDVSGEGVQQGGLSSLIALR
jgi:ATP-dependent protease Clp ATPase subunit